MRTYVRALERTGDRGGGAGAAAGLRGGRGAPFDAPEALDTRFYEVHAKSALNACPKASRMPFRWTINPYRGCTHACTYCLVGRHADPDGRRADAAASRICASATRSIGTVRAGRLPPLRAHAVLAHWSTDQAGLASCSSRTARELIASGDHRFLTRPRLEARHRLASRARADRPHLTLEQRADGHRALRRAARPLAATTAAATCAASSAATGTWLPTLRAAATRIARAIGSGSRSPTRGALARAPVPRELGVATDEFVFAAATGTTRAMRAIRTSARRVSSRSAR